MNPLGWAESILRLVYPNICQICKKQPANRDDGYICQSCRTGVQGVKRIVSPYCACCGLPFDGAITVAFECSNCKDMEMHFRSARSAVAFSGVVREAIHGYKYAHAIWFEVFLVNLLAAEAVPVLRPEDWDFLVPIPLHWMKRLERSFNQAQRLANALSNRTGIPVNARLLRRTRRTESQARLSKKERTENVKKAFKFNSKTPISGARLVLIDDVLTTGATASSCAKVLRQNGAAIVDVWTVARNLMK